MKEQRAIANLLDRNETSKQQAYDNYCKNILSNKQILAYILKNCIQEYKDIPIKKIPRIY